MLRAWAVVALCFLMLLLGAGPVYYAYGNYAIAFQQEFSASRTVINIAFTVVSVVGTLGSAPVGMAIDRWGVRAVATVGIVFTAAGFWLTSMASTVWQVVILYSSLIGFADVCLSVVITNYLISHWFQKRRGLALGLSLVGTSAAGVVFPPLTDLLILDFGWRGTFGIYALLYLALLPLIWWLARVPAAIPEFERIGRRDPRAELVPMPLKEMFTSRAFWVVSLSVGAMLGANTGVLVSLVSFATTRGLTTTDGSYLLSALGLAAVSGKVIMGATVDRINHANALRTGIALQFFGMLILAWAQQLPVMVVGTVMFGLGLGAALPVWGAGIAAIFGLGGYGRVLGWSRAVMTPLSILFPMVAGAVYDRTGEYLWCWLIFAAVLGLGFLALLLMPRRDAAAMAEA